MALLMCHLANDWAQAMRYGALDPKVVLRALGIASALAGDLDNSFIGGASGPHEAFLSGANTRLTFHSDGRITLMLTSLGHPYYKQFSLPLDTPFLAVVAPVCAGFAEGKRALRKAALLGAMDTNALYWRQPDEFFDCT